MENRIKKIVKIMEETELIKEYVKIFLDGDVKYKIITNKKVIEIVAGIYERYPKLDWLEMEHRGITVNDEWDYESYMDMTITQFCEKSTIVKKLLVKQD